MLDIPLSSVPIAAPVTTPGEPHYLFTVDPDAPDVLHFRIDNSTLSNFQSCPKKGEFYAIDRRERPSSIALTAGGALHAGLEPLYKGEPIHYAVACVHEFFADRALVIAPDEYRTPDFVAETLRAYHAKHFPLSFRLVANSHGNFMVEQPFDLIIGRIQNPDLPQTFAHLLGHGRNSAPIGTAFREIVVHWTGKIDAVVTFGNDDIWVLDHKTTSMGGVTFFKEFELSQQTIGYCWAFEQLTGIRPTGFILDSIIWRKPSRTGKGTEFDMTRYPYQSWHYEEWKSDILHTISDFAANLTRNSFPRNRTSCSGKYGMCPYHEICTDHPSNRAFALSTAEYSTVTWSPLNA